MSAPDEHVDLSPRELLERQRAGESWQLLDVREAWEIEIAKVESAVTIRMSEIQGRMQELDSDVPVAVLCHSGIRSAQVAAWLKIAGFRRVANVTGGIDSWSLTVDASIPRY
ncbi:MAG: rhodanese-like domain-containing protein [Pseudomonadota bacterium]